DRAVSASDRGFTGEASGPGKSRARAAPDVDHVAVARPGILVEETGDQYLAVERDDLAILLAASRPFRPDIILAALAALEAQFLRRCLVGQMHDDTTVGARPDHIGVFALA